VGAETTREPPAELGPSRELEAVKRFPEGNPEPVLQIAPDGTLLYANQASAPKGLGRVTTYFLVAKLGA
jgi:hypothetical protein